MPIPTRTATEDLPLLRLLHLADSALPVGGAAHSFGLETLTDSGIVTADDLHSFLCGWLAEGGALEAAACRLSHRLASRFTLPAWIELNDHLSALKIPRESRRASLSLGRRLLSLLADVTCDVQSSEALESAAQTDSHYSAVFGLIAGDLKLPESETVLALLHQSVANFVSAGQRLLPVGQFHATRLLWNIKPLIIETASRGSAVEHLADVYSFAPMLELAAMRHPYLATRLFIS